MALDADGSTLGLVNAANPNSAPVTTYTYDPSGTPTVSGTANDWPFLFDGSEHELTDPASLYYEGSGNYYDPLIMRELAQVDATGLGQPNLGGSSGGGSKGTGGASRRGTGEASGPAHAEFQIHIGGSNSESTNIDSTTLTTIVEYVALAAATFGLYELFDDLFGGGGSSLEIPRQMIHGRHPLYDQILQIRPSETPTESSSASTESEPTAPSTPCNPAPLQQIVDNTSDGPGNAQWCQARCTDLALERGINRDKAPDQSMWFYRCYNQCMGTGDYPEWRPYFPRNHNTVPDSSSNFQVPKISPWWVVIPLLPSLARALGFAAGF
jgi:hypothetical protein